MAALGALEQDSRQGKPTLHPEGPILNPDVVRGLLSDQSPLAAPPLSAHLAPSPAEGTAHTQDIVTALGQLLSYPSGLQAPFVPEADLETGIPVQVVYWEGQR